MANKLVLRSKNSPFTGQFVDINQGSVLSHGQLDDNFIYLKGQLIWKAELNGNDLVFTKIGGETISVDLSSISTSGTSSGDTYVVDGYLNGTTLVLERNDNVDIEIELSGLTSAFTDSVTYTNLNPTLVNVGGIEAGSTFNSVPLQDMWTDLLYPELTPTFTSFDLFGFGTILEVGATISAGSQTFTWATSNSSFIQPNTIDIYNVTGGLSALILNTANDGSETVTFPSNVQKTSQSSHQWRIYADRTNGSTFYKNHTISWYWRKFYGTSTSTTLDAIAVSGLTSQTLSNTRTGTYVFAGGGYKYFVWHNSYGSVDLFRDESTNLQVAMADPSDGYTNFDGEYYYDTVTLTNTYGITSTYRIYRTKNILGGAINIIVS